MTEMTVPSRCADVSDQQDPPVDKLRRATKPGDDRLPAQLSQEPWLMFPALTAAD